MPRIYERLVEDRIRGVRREADRRRLRHALASSRHKEVYGMKWVTRKNANVDRIACPWLIQRFVDKDAQFLFVPADEVSAVAGREDAVPFDVKGVELGHVDG